MLRVLRGIRRYVTNLEPIVPPEGPPLPIVDIYKFRKWRYMVPYEETLSHDFKQRVFTVSSYNILSQHYLWPTVYSYIPPKYLNLQYRLGLLNQIYRQLDCDIMCFQEMEYDLYKQLWADKSKYGVFQNYDSVFVKKLKPGYWGDRSEDKLDGCSIFVKQSKFEILDHDCFELRDRNFISGESDKIDRLMSRNTVGVIALLRHIKSGRIIFCANTHLYWNSQFEDVKLLQTMIMTRELEKFIAKVDPGNKDVIMCGDFNSNSRSMIYEYLSTGSLTPRMEQTLDSYSAPHIPSPQSMISSYPRDKYTVYTPHYKDAIDYIWYGSKSKLDLVRILDGVATEYLSQEIGFPNDKYPSDHIPIVSEFSLSLKK